jgi:RNA polymerase sporulation-specific sigma factor
MFDNEQNNELIEKIKEKLTPLEQQVFELKINNFNYNEIAEILDKDSKSIDNALQRIKNKIKDKIMLTK